MTHKIPRILKLMALVLFLLPVVATAQSQVTIDSDIDADMTLESDTEYILDGLVFVKDGATLTIEAGTHIYAQDGEGQNATALVVSTEGMIQAQGTPSNPIVFTSIQAMDSELTKDDVGLWGGVVLLGESTTNNQSRLKVEGVGTIAENQGKGDLAEYGGNNPEDSTGTFMYVSIRHTGMNIGQTSGNEIQGLTMGAVGSGTTIHHVESFSGFDDGFEWFGGTVNTKYLVSAFVGDDAFDTDQGFRGKNQFWFAIQDADNAGHMAEQDGAGGDEFYKPYAYPQIANATYIGTGQDTTGGDVAESILLRDNTGVRYVNSVFADDFKDPFLRVEDLGSGEDSRNRLEADSITFENSVFASSLEKGQFSVLTDLGSAAFVNTMLSTSGYSNTVVDPQFKGITRTPDSTLDPRADASAMWSNVATLEGDFWTQTDYKGAFGNENWLVGWTALHEYGFTPDTGVGTKIEDENDKKLPTEISLRQNYPNPFNPTTNITYALPTAQNVELTVYDMLGRKVATLIDARQGAGSHTVTFDASNLSSGIYIYRLSGQNFTMTKKMTLMK